MSQNQRLSTSLINYWLVNYSLLHNHVIICLYVGKVEDTSNDSGDGLIVVVAVLSVLLVVTVICVVLLVIWNIKLNIVIAKMKRK